MCCHASRLCAFAAAALLLAAVSLASPAPARPPADTCTATLEGDADPQETLQGRATYNQQENTVAIECHFEKHQDVLLVLQGLSPLPKATVYELGRDNGLRNFISYATRWASHASSTGQIVINRATADLIAGRFSARLDAEKSGLHRVEGGFSVRPD